MLRAPEAERPVANPFDIQIKTDNQPDDFDESDAEMDDDDEDFGSGGDNSDGDESKAPAQQIQEIPPRQV